MASRGAVIELQRAILANLPMQERPLARYDSIIFDCNPASSSEAIIITPYLDATTGPLKGRQPLSIDLQKLSSEPSEQKSLAGKVWEGVTNAEQDELTRVMVGQLVDKYERILKDPRSENYFREDAQLRLDRLTKLNEAINRGEIKREITTDYASLKVFPVS